jgi:hypothetical protein
MRQHHYTCYFSINGSHTKVYQAFSHFNLMFCDRRLLRLENNVKAIKIWEVGFQMSCKTLRTRSISLEPTSIRKSEGLTIEAISHLLCHCKDLAHTMTVLVMLVTGLALMVRVRWHLFIEIVNRI